LKDFSQIINKKFQFWRAKTSKSEPKTNRLLNKTLKNLRISTDN